MSRPNPGLAGRHPVSSPSEFAGPHQGESKGNRENFQPQTRWEESPCSPGSLRNRHP